MKGLGFATGVNSFTAQILMLTISLVAQILTFVALLVGRIDWAILFFYSASAFSNISRSVSQKTWRSTPAALTDIAVMAAVPTHSFQLAAAGMVLNQIVSPLARTRFADRVAAKPTRADYLQRLQATTQHHKEKREPQSYSLRTYCDLEMWDEAQQELNRQRNTSVLKAQDVRKLQARIDLGQGRYQAVIDTIEKIPPAEMDDILNTLARAYAKQGLYETALRVAQEAVRKRCEDAEYALGDVYAESGDLESALLSYERALQRHRDKTILSAAATILMELGDYREARVLLRQAIQTANYLRVEDLQKLAACCRRLGDERGALKAERLADRIA